MPTPAESGYVVPPRLWRWAGTRRAVSVFVWLLALGTGAYHLWHARTWFGNDPNTSPALGRPDGNNGHAQIDFGGQWVMGRMIVLGHGRELYHRQRQWEAVRGGFKREYEPPAVYDEYFLPKAERKAFKADADIRHDSDWLMHWFMGTDPPEWKTLGGAVAVSFADLTGHPLNAAAFRSAAGAAVTPELEATLAKPALGGPLYPPVHGFLYAPLGLFEPATGYAIFQYIALAAAYFAGLGVSVLSRGRVWWSVASLAILMYPGCRTGLDLGQNPLLSLCILVWGWVLAARGREWLGGAVWGLFVFKPVWGLAFFLVPVLTRRWRLAAGMVLVGGGLAAATLPFVGLQAWFDWLAVGKEAAALYDVNKNWIHLSRDMQGMPRRAMFNFDVPEKDRAVPGAGAIGWGLWGLVFVGTTTLYLLRGNRRLATGVGAAFLFLGAYQTCYRFMYYDVLLSAAGVALLFADPRRFVTPRPFAVVPEGKPTPAKYTGYVNSFPLTVLVLLFAVDSVLIGLKVEATVGVAYLARVVPTTGGGTAVVTPRVSADTSLNYPFDAALVFALWVWCGWRLWRDGDDREPPPP